MEKNVLVSGASFAGLSTAYWMKKLGFNVTVVEIAKGLKKGGTPVNIRENTVDIVKRMGLLDQIKSNKINMESTEFKNSDDVTEKAELREDLAEDEYEIERDVLLNMMFEAVEDDVEFIFGDSIVSLKEESNGVYVTFKGGQKRSFDLVFGCDGIHSVVRKLCFGEEAEFSHFLKTYFSITIVNNLLIRENTTQMYNEPGKAIMLNAYNNKTDIVLCFSSDQEIPYDYRNEEQQRKIILDQFSGLGWRTPELLEEVKNSKTFYFDKLCQMKMPSWTKGRVALVGDAGFCASPAAGMGGSLAIDGAAALADAFEKCQGNFELAFQAYNKNFRPFIEEVQATAEMMVDFLVPRTEEAIRERNAQAPSA
ncbi:FAD-binding monooxygenase [Paenibacillus pectinilyticus]|uniref:FAD-binding monooxygenase n=1 Tax=Paenibacillus pectinilyticus TaxID=512399 RepID=A0A1C0ZYY9_9BACL|nr:FAD-dependent monooxygenase [Paenibacillus pectinilyticus]OCT13354.1 FAD-binding monooxygenase [Paenibacillus pectinilyticus]